MGCGLAVGGSGVIVIEGFAVEDADGVNVGVMVAGVLVDVICSGGLFTVGAVFAWGEMPCRNTSWLIP